MIKDTLVVEVQLENVVLKDLNVLLERLVKWDLLEGSTGPRGVLKGCVELLVFWSARTCCFNWWKRRSWTERR